MHGPGTDEPLVWNEGAGSTNRRFLHADERGSAVALSDGSGAVTTINRYDEYGIPASTNMGRFQYTGQTWLPEVGMYYYKARIYSPTLGRFMQTDPIAYADGMNWYDYVGGDPVNGRDPSGLWDVVARKSQDGGGGGFYRRNSGSGSRNSLRGGGQGGGGGGRTATLVPPTPNDQEKECEEGAPSDSCTIYATAAGQTKPTVFGDDLTSTSYFNQLYRDFSHQPKPITFAGDCGAAGGAEAPAGNFSKSCARHDQCYANQKGRKACDVKFSIDILATCAESSPIPAACIVPALLYPLGTLIFGGDAYKAAG